MFSLYLANSPVHCLGADAVPQVVSNALVRVGLLQRTKM